MAKDKRSPFSDKEKYETVDPGDLDKDFREAQEKRGQTLELPRFYTSEELAKGIVFVPVASEILPATEDRKEQTVLACKDAKTDAPRYLGAWLFVTLWNREKLVPGKTYGARLTGKTTTRKGNEVGEYEVFTVN